MENLDKDLKELKEERTNNYLSLRKKKLNQYMLIKRLGLMNKNYAIKKEDIIVREEFKNKKFSDLPDLLNFCSGIFGDQKSDINDIKFAIVFLKLTQIKEDKGEVSKSNIIPAIAQVITKYINDIIIVDELLSILIIFAYFLNIETLMDLINNYFLEIYSKLSVLYFKDKVIFHDLITLLGNLANNNRVAQKIFYQTKLFEEIYNLINNEKAPQELKDISIWFLCNFTVGIQKNNYFINNLVLFRNLVDIMVFYLDIEKYTEYCLEALRNLCEIESLVEYILKKDKIFRFICENTNSKYYIAMNKVIVNISSYNENINIYLLENFKLIPYLLRLYQSSSHIIKGQVIFIIGNLFENHPSKVNEKLYNSGLCDIVFTNLDSPYVEILDKSLFIFNVILISSDKEGIFRLFQKNIHLKLINILKLDYSKDIIEKVIDAIIEFLQKDTNDRIIKESFIDNGLKEVFSTLELDRNDVDIFMKVEAILRIYL